ncbi:pyridoxal kinase PdxY [uncultured Oxalicibacterium sp.]|uniref:pyridoxal kinase PdxY n=1 Tax=uncultured Oxalicibacterium sp. TaxID=1168540 RepID=UPI0025D353B4|nr:pyridoxal kinase PdxY [uncultured Oxalicibacterium sp.]
MPNAEQAAKTGSTPLVLSIQSHVAYGHVGNAAAVLPLQLLGVQPVAIHTVQFSNHTGYGEFKGQVFSADHIRDVLDGLRARGVLENCCAVLSGYLGDAAIGEVILSAVRDIRAQQPNLIYLCDPVMGDVGRGVFVRPGIPEFLRNQALPEASLITPNHYEFELLCGHAVTSVPQTIETARTLLGSKQRRGPTTVVITSLRTEDLPDDRLHTLVVTNSQAWIIATPLIQCDPLPNGMGDVLSAILLGRLLTGHPVQEATALAVSSLYALVARTAPGQRDLPLITERVQLTEPQEQFHAISV